VVHAVRQHFLVDGHDASQIRRHARRALEVDMHVVHGTRTVCKIPSGS